jgi:hypothetical protein
MDDALWLTIAIGDNPNVKLLVQGGTSIAGTLVYLPALHHAACHGEVSIVEWLLVEGGTNITGVDYDSFTVLLCAAKRFKYENVETVQWLLEYGEADIMDTTPDGETVWNLLAICSADVAEGSYLAADCLTALLHVMVLRSAPPAALVVQMAPRCSRVVEEGARLRARLPAYLARRRALLAEHILLIVPLRALISGYDEPTTTKELWATGLGARP